MPATVVLENSKTKGSFSAKHELPKTVLVLATERSVEEEIIAILENCGLTSLPVSTLAELGSSLVDRDVCLVLCEGTVPEGNFRDVLRSNLSRAGVAPIVFFSRFADWPEYIEAVQLGAADFLRYPFPTGELPRIVNSLVSGLTRASRA